MLFIKKTCKYCLLSVCVGVFSTVLLAVACEGFRLERVMQAVRQCYGENAADTVRDWDNILTLFQAEAEQRKLTNINTYLNQKLRADSDLKFWGQEDYWSTPIEAQLKGCGDCDDYAIAKYFSLKFSGVPVSKLRLTYVKALIGEAKKKSLQAHMVLTYYPTPDAEPLILDNMVNEILPASRRTDLVPIYSFNSEGAWKSGAGAPMANVGSRLSKWTDLVEKMKIEGFE
jgi:predicted transglutaminase-like cysteine proteinase